MNRLRGGVPWVVVAAGCAAVVGLAGWPRPTLGVLCIVIGATALLAGLRGLLAEHRGQKPAEPSDDLTAQEARDLADDLSLQLYRAQDALDFVEECCDIADREGRQPTTAAVRQWLRGAQCARQGGLVLHPDASGDAPETTRPIPDATGQQPADQPGDHPDDLRNRIAGVLLARIKQAVITDGQPFGPGPVSTLIAATEYDLADVVLGELAPEFDALAAARAGDGPWLRAYREDLIAAQDAMHRIERQAQDWARLAPPNDVGCTPDDTAFASAGRVLLDLLSKPVHTERA